MRGLRVNKKLSLSIMALLAVIVLIILAVHKPIPQPLAYSDFADKRQFFGIPNFNDVVSNILFALVGALGFFYLVPKRSYLNERFIHNKERYAYIIFFVGVFFVSIGSAYYHLNPNNQTLTWDRLPMSVAFMALFAAMISERINYRLGLYALIPLVVIGIASVVYWHYTDDLRAYIFVQFFPLLALLFLLTLFPASYTDVGYIIVAFVWYLLAKVFELYDKAIFIGTGEIISGHTLKHIAAAIAIFFVFLYIALRKIKQFN